VRWKIEERYTQPSLIAAAVLLLVFLSYCLVYLITPYGLAWQVQSSFDRLLLQIWPSVLLVFFIQLRSVADPVAAAVPAKGVTRKSPERSNKPVPVGNKVK
jgi:hypothetical protein